MRELRGWLLDLYEDARQGAVLWLVGEDGVRYRLHHPFEVTFYVAGPMEELKALARFLSTRAKGLPLEYEQRRDLFQARPLPVLAVRAPDPVTATRLFEDAAGRFPRLSYYDVDLPLDLRYAARYGTFPLAYCRVRAGDDGLVREIEPLESPWELDAEPAALRTLSIEPDVDPAHAPPRSLLLSYGRSRLVLPLEPERLLVNLAAVLRHWDPDLVLTRWGDTWILPLLLRMAGERGLPLPLNREEGRGVARRAERSYFSYGRIIHRGSQVRLFGRVHIDQENGLLWDDCGLDGVFELARVTGLSLQTVARTSPGSGISAMEVLTALRQGVLVPWHKGQAEQPKEALEMMRADQGGLVYQPLLGLHFHVGELDFSSMYPSLMARHNISPEVLPGTEAPPGLIPQTLQPLLDKRLALKGRLGSLPAWDPRRKREKARASALKWLLVTCFGYLGYKNARFGRIEAHEAVTAWGRETLLQAKELAEEMGFTVLQLYVDGLWVQKEGAETPRDFQPLLEAIAERTDLSIALEGVYRWIAFLPSREDERQPVPNRYFGAYQDGSLKLRGIEARRHDTPLFVARVQGQLLGLLSRGEDLDGLRALLPEALALLRRAFDELRRQAVPLEDLLVAQRLSRELQEYRDPSPAALAASQLEALGKRLRPGEEVRFVYVRGEPPVWAWDLPDPPPGSAVDWEHYARLLLRAGGAVLQPFGLDEAALPAALRRTQTLRLPAVPTRLVLGAAL